MEPTPLKTFIIYAQADAQFKDELLTHLRPFVKSGLLERWVDSDLLPGEEWEKRIEKELDAAHLVIMLVSADALNSDFIEKNELKKALDKKQAGAARVVPILVRDCFWEMHPDLSALQLLPKDEKGRIRGVAGWVSSDTAWTHCLRELKKLVDEIRTALQKEMEAAEAAKKAEELKKQQSAEIEKARRSRHRLDEAFWKKTCEGLQATSDAQEKINLLEDYLQDTAHGNHRAEAEDQIEELHAELTAIRKVKEAQEKREAERRRQEQEAARFAEQARQTEIEREKHQKAEQQKQKAERLQKQDEIDWKATLEAIGMVKTEQEKIYFLEKYLNEAEHKIHRVEAEKQLGILKAADAAQRIEEKQRLEAERKKRAAEQAEQERKKQEAAREAALLKMKQEIEKGQPEMVLVRGGTFQMGSNDCDDEKPIHSVTLPDFEIGKYPVTQKLWQEIMGNNPSHFKGCDDCPVEQVSWDDVQEFLKKLNQKYPGKNYRLLSEAEWEYAARGGKQSKGYTFAGSKEIDEVAWHRGNSGEKTHPVGGKKANELGIYDLSGNVREWCQDVWHDNYQGAPTDGSAWDVGSKDVTRRLLRGGSWGSKPYDCLASDRLRSCSDDRFSFYGFRLARH